MKSTRNTFIQTAITAAIGQSDKRKHAIDRVIHESPCAVHWQTQQGPRPLSLRTGTNNHKQSVELHIENQSRDLSR